MASDERDRSFDKALARHLRSSAALDGAANTPADPALQRDACPDAETLAAYHERALLPGEMNSRKEHIVGCARCQLVLTQLEATDEIPLQVTPEEEVLAMKESEPVMAGRIAEELTTPAAQSRQSQRAAGAVQPERTRASELSRGARWRWLAPAGAIAAGLLVWIAVHENRPLRFLTPSDTQIAKNQVPSAPLPLSAVQQPAPSAQAHATRTMPQSAAGEIASSNARASSEAPRLGQKSEVQAESKAALEKSSSDKESGARKDAGRDALEEPSIAANQAELDDKTVARAMPQKVEVQTQAANVQSPNQSNYSLPKVSGPGPLVQADALKKMKVAPAAPVSGVAGRLQGAPSMMEFVTVSNPRLIAAPGANVIWRTGRAGLIEFSSDGGKSWSRQISGVIVDLLTGSAPSDRVCWIVGRVGTILLTTDGGAHWKLITSPLAEDLGGIHATDALHATIWNARNTKSFDTSDGGVTWKGVANE